MIEVVLCVFYRGGPSITLQSERIKNSDFMAALLDLRLILADLGNGLNLCRNRSLERSLFEHELRLGLTKLLGASLCIRA